MKNLQGMKIAILLTDGFEQVEMVKPREALQQAGASISLISPKKDQIQGWNHYEKADFFPVDVNLEKANPDDYDALLLPGGVLNPDQLRMEPKAIQFIQRMAKMDKPIAAICHGPWTLINAEVVKGHKLTSWPSLAQDLKNAGADWVDETVVTSGNLVTSRKPQDIPAFNEAMINLFSQSSKTKFRKAG